MFYDVHLLAPADWDEPRVALARDAARSLQQRSADPGGDLPRRRPRRPRGPRRPAADPADRADPAGPADPSPDPSPDPAPTRSQEPAPAVAPDVLERLRGRWVRPGEGLRVDVDEHALLVRLPYWYVGKQARVQAKVLHGLVADLEKATGRRAFDPQLDDWFARRDPRDTAAVLDAVADFEAREHVDSPAVDARRAERAARSRGRRLRPGRPGP